MNITLIAQENGVRADQFLSQSLDNLTRSAAQKLLEAGHVLRGGKKLLVQRILRRYSRKKRKSNSGIHTKATTRRL